MIFRSLQRFSPRSTKRVAGFCFQLGLLLSCFSCEIRRSPPDQTSTTTPTTKAKTEAAPKVPRNALIPSRNQRSLAPRNRRPDDWFSEGTAELGIDFSYRDGSETGFFQLLESVGGGVAAIDMNHDGWYELFFTGGGQLSAGPEGNIGVTGLNSRLFRNHQGQRFDDITLVSGLNSTHLYTHGCTVTDFDADGFDDLVVAGFGGVELWRNSGDGTFLECSSEFGIQANSWNVTVAAGDCNQDGLVDLYLVTYADWQPQQDRHCFNDQQLRDICGPTLFEGDTDRFLMNNGTGFTDATDAMGLVQSNRGLGILGADFDRSGTLDFAVVNDVQENQLYNNVSGRFEETGLLAGIAYSSTGEREGSMGIDLGDFNHDGWPDLWYANYAHQDNSLMKNQQGNGFVHSAGVVGLTGVSRRWVGFGTGFADFNCDGWDDLFVINGHVAYERLDSPYYQPPQLFQNQEGHQFAEVSQQGGPYFSIDRSGRGAIRVDVNNDGSSDLAITHQNESVAVLLNNTSPENWISLDLVGVTGDRNAIGAYATIQSGDRKLYRWKYTGGSYLSHQDERLLFTLTDDLPVDVVVTWLGGEQETFASLSPNQTHVLREGMSTYAP